MSQNMHRRLTPPPTVNTQPSTPQTSQNSDYDDDYGGVDDISSGEEDGDEPNVEGAEERAIISSEDVPAPSQPLLIEETFQEEYDLSRADLEAFDLFEEQILNESDDKAVEARKHVPKHVHWESLHGSESESNGSDNDADWCTDLFMEKDELNYQFRQLIDKDDDKGQFSDDGFYYGDAATDEEADFDESGDDSELSGYDSDESGLTTDEEDVPVTCISPHRSIIRATSEASTSSEEVIRPTVRHDPILGTWNHKSTTPYAIYDKENNKVRVFNLENFRRRMNMESASRSLMATPMNTPQQGFSSLQASPIVSNSGDIMLSGINSDFFDSGFLGSTEQREDYNVEDAFREYTNLDSSSPPTDTDESDDENLWSLEDLFDFGNDTSDEERAAGLSDKCPTDPPSSTPARATTTISEDQLHPKLDPLLRHFSRGNVGSFRAYQNEQSLLNRGLATEESLEFGTAATIRGVKAGRLHHANTPITPIRKKKRPVALESSPASPSPYAPMAKKRKLNYEERPTSLKRNRES
ncbi:uncharacterized protein L3040_001128 [Drepanopeziza brunnea f. sp. 'multigermtubi']|uniref:Uncharacterized protein n=1 Tax=Marssonina brunnea f. sp. multigermtubi (strain MB_m1) TaxID=1072389 RepID=K1WGY8_MARBU|nr:uncharacterized protein MBM_05314 [Drepanopeziza brunnea f. sp. 'multigermtubi' MB_m1]EKD16845.1 hypothetical protein MBM_05314 [Drepanopeziza brunnea f. sp. 'multigermtubi' MB_m1]KAJ5054866.1 hypothetical protein L3040_001128 [Drepanopeziza brunnea f. sp. 'multigermtubi']